MTEISTHNLVRSDVGGPPGSSPAATAAGPLAETPALVSRRWALAGVGAAITAIGGTVASAMIGSVYDSKIVGDAPAILEQLGDKVPYMIVFHVLSSVGALLLGVFGLGLHRRLRAQLPADSLLPGAAGFGLLGTAVVIVLGSALDTEFIFAVGSPGSVLPQSAAFYDHWINTVPGCWILAGLAGLAMFGASRRGAVPRWMGLVGLVLGGLTVLTGISPLQYMAGATGGLWLFVTAVGFLAGDRTTMQR